jgi:hypothetical protein
MTEKEVLKLALEVLEINLVFLRNVKPFKGQEDLASDCVSMTEETITAIKEALAQPEQEPVAYVKTVIEALYENSDPVSVEAAELLERITTPPQRKPLSLQERTKIVRANKMYHDKDEFDAYGVIDDVEAAHGIKGEA